MTFQVWFLAKISAAHLAMKGPHAMVHQAYVARQLWSILQLVTNGTYSRCGTLKAHKKGNLSLIFYFFFIFSFFLAGQVASQFLRNSCECHSCHILAAIKSNAVSVKHVSVQVGHDPWGPWPNIHKKCDLHGSTLKVRKWPVMFLTFVTLKSKIKSIHHSWGFDAISPGGITPTDQTDKWWSADVRAI